MGLDIIDCLYALPTPTELDDMVLFSYCGEDFARPGARTLTERLGKAGVALPESELVGAAPG
ncbi:hypothetical protein [Nonomuraea sp. LPB2021202275-12-8]|uniref:hypothetical protein n=1 Tax=Nonomuraea sp. LPB2021202275-12-8 TaxID=3120159 RepID=UPI00300D7267